MTFNDKIDQFMADNNYSSLKQLAIASDIPYTTLRDFYEKKSADNSRLSTIRKLSKFMKCSMDYLAYDEIQSFDNATPVELDDNIVNIPVLGVIKAGIPIEAQQDIIEYIEIPKKWILGGKKFYALKISGDSMYPKYNEDDIVIFEQINDMSLVHNKDCAVMVNGDDATFKKVLLSEQGIVLVPYNMAYEMKMYNPQEIIDKPIRVIGVAREKRTKLD